MPKVSHGFVNSPELDKSEAVRSLEQKHTIHIHFTHDLSGEFKSGWRWDLGELQIVIDKQDRLEESSEPSNVIVDKGKYVHRKKNNEEKTHPSCYNIFINCNGIVECIDISEPMSLEDDFKSCLLMITGTRSIDKDIDHNSQFYSYVQLYGIVFSVDHFESEIENNVSNIYNVEVVLLRIAPIKDNVCMKVKWIEYNHGTFSKANNSDNFILILMVMYSGMIKLCKIHKKELFKNYISSEFENEKSQLKSIIGSLDQIWEYDPNGVLSGQRITCADISYSSGCETAFTIAAGTNDGFVHVWELRTVCSDMKSKRNGNPDPSSDIVCVSFSKTIPITQGFKDVTYGRRIVDLAFVPLPDSYILAIATYSGCIILWDMRHGHLEGEIKTYNNVTKPINAVGWTKNCQYLLGGSSSGFYIDWQQKGTITSITPEKFTGRKSGCLENICWDIDSAGDDVFLAFDDGTLLGMPLSNIGRRNLIADFTLYKWDFSSPCTEGDVSMVPNEDDTVIENIKRHIRSQFEADISFARRNGIRIIKCTGAPINLNEGTTNNRVLRSKVLSHHALVYSPILHTMSPHFSVKSLFTKIMNAPVSILSYGGNLGLIHMVIKC